ncbi:hypothetical protein L914_10486 [Phytophthora nicotianae]|uniref:Uncharacterized protein n=1 Tax=Phytophthora nicotianae TaxID=4792 RepID=W2N8S2_PHYNI|nr:hypothetical protein L914_10486 [Phytophthora nicotianae]
MDKDILGEWERSHSIMVAAILCDHNQPMHLQPRNDHHQG